MNTLEKALQAVEVTGPQTRMVGGKEYTLPREYWLGMDVAALSDGIPAEMFLAGAPDGENAERWVGCAITGRLRRRLNTLADSVARNAVTETLKSQGIPQRIYADNGPAFGKWIMSGAGKPSRPMMSAVMDRLSGKVVKIKIREGGAA